MDNERVKDILRRLQELDRLFPEESDRFIKKCLKIDLFMNEPNDVFNEALRQSGIDKQDFIDIVYTRHVEKKDV